MKKNIVFLIVFLLATLQIVSAQENQIKIVILDPTMKGNVEEGTDILVREEVSSAIVNIGKYHIIERLLIDKILQEQKFARSGMVDDSQIVELGKMAGADKVCLTTLVVLRARTSLSVKVVDVKTAQVEKQSSKTVKSINEAIDNIASITLEALGETATSGGKGLTIGGFSLGGGKATTQPKPAKVSPVPVQVIQSNNADEESEISLFFAGSKNKKNSSCHIFFDGVQVGAGSLSQGFSVSFIDPRPGKHEVKIVWENTVATKTYDINTSFKNHFEFQFVKGGFGMEFGLKKD